MKKLSDEESKLVVDNLNLVHHTLKSTHLNSIYDDYDDYFQEGCIGLILAAMRFDESKGFQFSTFAIPTIKGSVSRYKRDRSHIIRIRRSDYDTYIKVMALLGQGYSLDDIYDELDISPVKLNEILSAYSLASLDSEISGKDGSSTTVSEMVADWRNEYEDLLFNDSIEDALNKVMSTMKEPSKSICEEWFYAAMCGEKLNQHYFAGKYELSQAQVSRILNKFKQKLLFYLGMEL